MTTAADTRYDVIIVGARCAGATAATLLAAAGRRVLVVDRDRLPSDVVSTHVLFPNTLARLEELGVMSRLRERHTIPLLKFGWRVLGHEVGGTFTPVGDHDRAACIRRVTLDAALVETAVAAGAEVRAGVGVVGLLGKGQIDDPVRGVVLDGGQHVEAPWVLGADGRASTVARHLGLPRTGEQRGEMAFLLAYWRGLPPSEWSHMDVHETAALLSAPCEDGVHLLSLAGRAELTRGTAAEREVRYHDALRQFPAVLNPRLLARAARISDVIAVPETMMRGYDRQACGPGWALLGDAGHFKHPATAQGIGDAVEQAWYVAGHLAAGRPLSEYQRWRDERGEEHAAYSFDLARYPSPRAAVRFSGLAADPAASQQFRDVFPRHVRPSVIFTPERDARWNAAWAYRDGHQRVAALLEDASDEDLAMHVPACPDWTVHDLVAHLVGVAGDTVRGEFFPLAPIAWRVPDAARDLERWTAGHVAPRNGAKLAHLLREWRDRAAQLELALRRGDGFADGAQVWVYSAPVADLAVHLQDLREALGRPGDEDAPVTRLGFAVYRSWLGTRLIERGLPALLLTDGQRSWTVGEGDPQATLTAPRLELFRTISGRRGAARIRGYAWEGEPDPYLPVLAPYPLPDDDLAASRQRRGAPSSSSMAPA